MKVVGVKEINYTSKKTQKPVHGYEVHGVYSSNRCLSPNDELTDKQFLSDFIVEKMGGVLPQRGDEIRFSYNRFGQVEDYEIN